MGTGRAGGLGSEFGCIDTFFFVRSKVNTGQSHEIIKPETIGQNLDEKSNDANVEQRCKLPALWAVGLSWSLVKGDDGFDRVVRNEK